MYEEGKVESFIRLLLLLLTLDVCGAHSYAVSPLYNISRDTHRTRWCMVQLQGTTQLQHMFEDILIMDKHLAKHNRF